MVTGGGWRRRGMVRISRSCSSRCSGSSLENGKRKKIAMARETVKLGLFLSWFGMLENAVFRSTYKTGPKSLAYRQLPALALQWERNGAGCTNTGC